MANVSFSRASAGPEDRGGDRLRVNARGHRQGQAAVDEHRRGHPLGVVGGEPRDRVRAERVADEHRPLEPDK